MIDNRYGEVPDSPVVMAACDSKYFMKFAPAFIASIVSNTKNDIHIHVINPDDEVFALACYLNSRVDRRVTYTFQDSDLSQYNDEQKRALYASLRFLVAPYILQNAGEILILDIDCLAMLNFKYPRDYSVGYFPRKPLEGTVGWEQEGTKVAAGCVYFDKKAMNVCNAVAETLSGLPLQWFNDQIALNHVFEQVPEELCWKYDWTFMDWEFKEGTIIWTGKGPRKYDNPKYVDAQNQYHDAIMNFEDGGVDKVILAPRLDIPFKKFALVKGGSVNEPIREHWERFVKKKVKQGYYKVESPRWMFNSKIESYFPNAQILVPHVEQHNWGGGDRTQFYMQTVFPELFTVDPLGWAGGAQYIASFDEGANYDDGAFNEMKKRLGQGKFGHLQSDNTPWNKIQDEYIIVPLQLPHDETIKYHSDFSVEEFVTALCEMAVDNPDMPQLVFKGHPVNLKSMQPLKEIIEGYKQLYVSDANFNELVKKAKAMFVLNGGSGQEAMLHEIAVACFGRCDYAPAVVNGNIKNPYDAWEQIKNDNWDKRLTLYKKWFDWYINDICIDMGK